MIDPARETSAARSLGSLMVCAAIVAAIAALVAATGPAGAEPAGSASASASTPPPPPPAARGADVPTERSEPPTAKEWKEGRAISVEGANAACTFKVLREYLRAACYRFVGVGLVAGEPADVRAWVSGRFGFDEKTRTFLEPTAIADVPLRRGKTSIVQFNDIDSGDYGPASFGDGGHVIVTWRDGEADPLIVMTPGS